MSKILNILTRSSIDSKTGGPGKVLINTIKGLERINQPYVINQSLENHELNWIHNSVKDLIKTLLIGKPAVVGPNLFVSPNDFPRFMPALSNVIYLHPATWCIDIWKIQGFTYPFIYEWPAGIDWEKFINDESERKKTNVLLYTKRRSIPIIHQVQTELETLGYKILRIDYGSYSENEFIEALRKSYFGVWLGTTESQGIALLEALSSNLPLIVINNTNMSDDPAFNSDISRQIKNFKGTTVPYFSDKCGIVIDSHETIKSAVKKLTDNYTYYAPALYIEENLTLEKCATKLMDFFYQLNDLNIHKTNSFYRKILLDFIYQEYVFERKFKTLLYKYL